MTLTDFLLARIAEDEAAAREALNPEPNNPYFGATAADALLGLAESEGADTLALLHFARHDPARVLAQCEAKRRIVMLCDGFDEQGREVRQLLALPYADHPDYNPAWRP